MLDQLHTLVKGRFHEESGGVFWCVGDVERLQECLKRYESLAQAENDWNRQKFSYPVGESHWERWQNNLTLAMMLQKLWQALLSKEYPARAFTLYISNELLSIETDEGQVRDLEIIPVLRLWSAANDVDGALQKALRVEDAGLDKIAALRGSDFTFYDSSEVFTATKKLRPDFVHRVTSDTQWSPGRVVLDG